MSFASRGGVSLFGPSTGFGKTTPVPALATARTMVVLATLQLLRVCDWSLKFSTDGRFDEDDATKMCLPHPIFYRPHTRPSFLSRSRQRTHPSASKRSQGYHRRPYLSPVPARHLRRMRGCRLS